MTTIGYSGTPLIKKLGFNSSFTVWVVNAPKEYKSWLGELPEGLRLTTKAPALVEAAHIFVTERVEMGALLSKLRNDLKQDGFVWVSWPKKSSKVRTDITEDTIREIALPLGFVDVKVCAITDVWSGLKLVIRKSDRK